MTTLNLIFDLTVTDIVPHLRKPPGQLKEDLQRYFKEIGLSTCYFNSLSSFNRCITLAAEPAVPQKYKCLGISDTAETHLELSAQEITKQAAIVAKQSTRNASSGISGGKTMGFEYAQQLQRGLCFIKRMRRESKNESMESKTVIINFSPDLSEQTTELMTLFFTYQTFHEKIDILDISGDVNPTLQQGCDITGGRYVSLKSFPASLLGCIARNFYISSASLNLFPTVIEREVDYRFPCRCHNTLVDLGYICASCLSVHCRPATKCVACGANFMPHVSIDELIERQATPPPPPSKKRHGMSLRTRRDLNIQSEQRAAIFPTKKAKREDNGQSEV
uniref:General transcription factor IIH subunit 3 n=1 Tax=Panagrolaimus sp. ES5 TaxID=591445 RepID=A0AC34FQB8_9BILA